MSDDKLGAPVQESLSALLQAFKPLLEQYDKGATERANIAAVVDKEHVLLEKRRDIRELDERKSLRRYSEIFGGAVLTVLLSLTVFLYVANRSAEVSELLKGVVLLAGGGSVGFSAGYLGARVARWIVG